MSELSEAYMGDGKLAASNTSFWTLSNRERSKHAQKSSKDVIWEVLNSKYMLDVAALHSRPSVHTGYCDGCKLAVSVHKFHLRHLHFGAYNGSICLEAVWHQLEHKFKLRHHKLAAKPKNRESASRQLVHAPLPEQWHNEFIAGLASLRHRIDAIVFSIKAPANRSVVA